MITIPLTGSGAAPLFILGDPTDSYLQAVVAKLVAAGQETQIVRYAPEDAHVLNLNESPIPSVQEQFAEIAATIERDAKKAMQITKDRVPKRRGKKRGQHAGAFGGRR